MRQAVSGGDCGAGGRRVLYFDLLNVLACFAVVTLHVNGAFWSYSDSFRWTFNLLVESVFYPAVAIFVMLTGATLMDYRKRYDTKTFFRRRFVKVAVPFLAWSLIAILFHVLKGNIAPADVTFASVAGWVLNGDYYSIYWFFTVLFGCYLSIPVLSLIPEEKRNKVFAYLVLYAFVTISLLPMVSYWTGIPYAAAYRSPVSGGYLLYVLLGYLLSRVTLKPWQRYASYALGLGALALRIVMTYRLSHAAGMVSYPYGDYLNFPCVFQAAALFIAARQLRLRWSDKAAARLRFAASVSFSIYLIHRFVMDLLVRFNLEPRWLTGTPWYSVLWPFVVYALSLLAAAAGKKIPGVRRLFP